MANENQWLNTKKDKHMPHMQKQSSNMEINTGLRQTGPIWITKNNDC